MSGAPAPVRARFWPPRALDSLWQRSRREPDGAGIGTFAADRRPIVDLEHAPLRRIRVSSQALSEHPVVVVATEPTDDDPGRPPLRGGELAHVKGAPRVTRHQVLDAPPAQSLTLADLDAPAAASQGGSSAG